MTDSPAEEAIRVADAICKYLELRGPVRAAMLKSSLQLKAPEYVGLIPTYGKLIGGETSTKVAFAATALLRKFKSDLTIHKFNRLVEDAGYLEVRERSSRVYKVISDSGLRYGRNFGNEPLWFEHTFEELLNKIA
jgi:hypothetical protein